jgi:anti-sigma B factor antagonist
MSVQIERIQQGTVMVLVPDGALIEDDVPGFAEKVRVCLNHGNVRLILQMNKVPFIDSAGLEALVGLSGEAMALGGEMKMSSLTDIGRDILRATRLDNVIEVHDSTEAARRTFV